MAIGKKLKKLGGDLEAQKQNVVSSKLTIREQIVVPLQPRVDESNNRYGLELAMVRISNSNNEIIPNTYWEF
jgi:hypothetical protein